MEEIYHIPALLSEAVAGLKIKPDGVYADATFGGGGHSRAIVAQLGPTGRLLGFDRDLDAMANVIDDPRFTFVRSDFRYMPNFMRYHGIPHFDGILADLGVSFHHFDDASRGFSFRADAPLDMRMNRRAPLTAADLIASATEESLTTTLRAYTDLKHPREVARALLKARAQAPVTTTGALAEAVRPAMNPKNEKKDLAQVFQALRIEVNGEMDALRRFLLATPAMLRQGGRLAILTYHSVEDRMVKNFMRYGNPDGEEKKDFYGRVITPWKPVTRSPITPSEEEIVANPRSRSAKLRIAELITPATEQNEHNKDQN